MTTSQTSAAPRASCWAPGIGRLATRSQRRRTRKPLSQLQISRLESPFLARVVTRNFLASGFHSLKMSSRTGWAPSCRAVPVCFTPAGRSTDLARIGAARRARRSTSPVSIAAAFTSALFLFAFLYLCVWSRQPASPLTGSVCGSNRRAAVSQGGDEYVCWCPAAGCAGGTATDRSAGRLHGRRWEQALGLAINAVQVILPPAPAVSNEREGSPLLV